MSDPRVILVADDHPLFREAVSLRLKGLYPHADVIEIDDFGAAPPPDGSARVDLIVVDLFMPGVGSGDAVARIVDAYPAAKVVVMSGHEEPEEIALGLSAGAKGFISKTMSSEQFRSALGVVIAGGTYAPTSLMRGSGVVSDARGALAKLTPRELEVLQLLVKGASNKEVCRVLDLAEPTVKLYVGQILKKLGARNRAEAAVKGLQAGLTPTA
jgi:DNA-binding NarL/FixJ family response regulator